MKMKERCREMMEHCFDEEGRFRPPFFPLIPFVFPLGMVFAVAICLVLTIIRQQRKIARLEGMVEVYKPAAALSE